MLGAAGFGSLAYIAAGTVVPYRINFENLGPGSVPAPTTPATAPAQRVEVTDQLSTNLDWDSLKFTEFGFGDTIVPVPAGRTVFLSTVEMTYNNVVFNVEVELSFDSATRIVRAVFQSLDPATSLPPDVLIGFLPPEDGTGIGPRRTSPTPSSPRPISPPAPSCATLLSFASTAKPTSPPTRSTRKTPPPAPTPTRRRSTPSTPARPPVPSQPFRRLRPQRPSR